MPEELEDGVKDIEGERVRVVLGELAGDGSPCVAVEQGLGVGVLLLVLDGVGDLDNDEVGDGVGECDGVTDFVGVDDGVGEREMDGVFDFDSEIEGVHEGELDAEGVGEGLTGVGLGEGH